MRKRLLQVMLLFTFLSFLPAAPGQAAADEAELKKVCYAFVCNCNCGTQIDACDETQCPTAKVFRAEIEKMLAEGKSEAEIRDYYISQFGEGILRAPLKKGFSLTAWILPFAGVAAGGAGIWLFLRRRVNGRAVSEAPPASAETELYEEWIEQERKKYL